MSGAFYVIATAMVVLALFCVIYPLIKEGRRNKRSQDLMATIFAIAVLLPAATIYLYARLGTPAAFVDHKAQDVQRWLDAAHHDDVAQKTSDARDAYAQVLQLDAQNTVAMVGWVEADMAQHADYAVDIAARRLLEKALALEPDNQRALWLFGISEFQQKDYAAASATWQRLLQLLDTGSDLARSVTQQIALAQAKANAKPDDSAPIH